jgi:hypothetical protein
MCLLARTFPGAARGLNDAGTGRSQEWRGSTRRSETRRLPHSWLGFGRRGYSVRRAFMGWMEAARFAGMSAARREQMAREMAATARASGSQEETP